MNDIVAPSPPQGPRSPDEETVLRALTRVGMAMGLSVREVTIDSSEPESADPDPLHVLMLGAKQSGIYLKETRFDDVDEVIGFVREGYPVVVVRANGSLVVLDKISGKKLEAGIVDERVTTRTLSRSRLNELLHAEPRPRAFVAKKELECDSISATPSHHSADHHSHEHPAPLRRFLGLLSMDRRDVWMVILFAFVAGVLTLASPLAIESLVNVVSWGIYVQPLIVLAMILLVALGLAGILNLLQTVVVEIIQRRQFVRIVSDLAHRFPRAEQAALAGEYPRELANRVFDIMTIQKATAVLLLDGVSIVLTTLLGLVLLAFYHPFLLGFDLVLAISMISITWILGRGGIRTAIDESIMKYRVVHWLQDVIATPTVFKTGGGEWLAIQRSNQLAADYINARSLQFRVVLRQTAFAITLQVIASTALLGLGGWLVIQRELTLGQLVASELVVTVVVGAFAKAGKSLEKFYDLMAGIDKVGHLLDVPVDPRVELGALPDEPAEVRWGELTFHGAAANSKVAAASVAAGSRAAIVGDDACGRSLLARTLAGLVSPTSGLAQIGGFDSEQAATGGGGRLVAYAGGAQTFHGTLRENVDLGRQGIGQSRVREVLQQVGLAPTVLQLPDALSTHLQTGGYPFSSIQVCQLVLARAMAGKPKVLVIDGLLDPLDDDVRSSLWESLAAADAPWTLIVATNRHEIAQECDSQIAVRKL